MTEPAVGASVCASGSQVWTGKKRHLHRRSRREAEEDPELLAVVRGARCRPSLVSKPTCAYLNQQIEIERAILRADEDGVASVSTPPAKVKRKNLLAA